MLAEPGVLGDEEYAEGQPDSCDARIVKNVQPEWDSWCWSGCHAEAVKESEGVLSPTPHDLLSLELRSGGRGTGQGYKYSRGGCWGLRLLGPSCPSQSDLAGDRCHCSL